MSIKIHTFELMAELTISEYHACSRIFYEKARGQQKCTFPKGQGQRCNFWSPKGVGLELQMTKHDFAMGYLYFIITPTRMLGNMDPDALYSPTEEQNQRLVMELDEILAELSLPIKASELSLHRVDLCKDARMGWSDVLIYIALLERGTHHPKWKKEVFEDERKTHSFRRASKRYQVTVYDKVYQLAKTDQIQNWDKHDHLLRMEVAVQSAGIRHCKVKYGFSNIGWMTELLDFFENGKVVFCDILKKIVPEGHYYSLKGAEYVIDQSSFHKNKKEALKQFLAVINRPSETSLYEISKEQTNKKRLLQLSGLYINPITIRARSNLDAMRSLYHFIDAD